jgi:hypothetical protein
MSSNIVLPPLERVTIFEGGRTFRLNSDIIQTFSNASRWFNNPMLKLKEL